MLCLTNWEGEKLAQSPHLHVASPVEAHKTLEAQLQLAGSLHIVSPRCGIKHACVLKAVKVFWGYFSATVNHNVTPKPVRTLADAEH